MSTNPQSQQERQMLDRLGDPVFAEALEVLQSIVNNPREREIYEARLKMRRDEQSRLDAAEARGEIRGEAKGRVRLLCELLHQPIPQLDGLTLDELVEMERDLQGQFGSAR